MAAYDESSSSSSGSSTYDVFLNFRGEETRNNFTGFLHRDLKRVGINVFMDSEDLWGGEEIKPALLQAIRRSKISIPVFSKGYADSKWCLMELVEIVRCHGSNGQIILPIFFDVEPTDVRHQTGSIHGSFQKHKEEFDAQMVESWKEALSEVGGISGYDLKQVNGNQPKLVDLVVDKALSELSSNRLGDVIKPIGLDARVEDLLPLLNVGSNDVLFMGICGIGGIGKTTIAKALYNKIFKSFHRSCFLANIREEAAGPKGLVSLQEQLIYSVTKRKVNRKISNVHCGQELIKERLQGENVLLILDDLDCRSQLDALAIELNWFGPGSRIIITSRDEHILSVAKVDEGKIYRPRELDDEQSLELFSLHAFSSHQPPEDYKLLSNYVLHLAGGLPLTLEVLGSSFFDIRDKEVWQSMLQKLEKIPNKEVHKKLRISYDNLEDDEKSIFLDAACFFVGWRKETVISIWDACGFDSRSAIKKLTQRSLLKFTKAAHTNSKSILGMSASYDELRMNDQIQAMGRGIVFEESPMEPSKRSRLWSYDEILEVLQEHKGTRKIEGILPPYFDRISFPVVCLKKEDFTKMSKLRFLYINGAQSEGDFPHLPSSLSWFCWKTCPLEILPANFYHNKLVHMDLSESQIRQAWTNKAQSENQRFQKLKVLRLRHCDHLSKSPDFSWFPYLEIMDIGDCHRMVSLHKSIGDLKFLAELYLDGTEIEELPNSICRLSSLKRLNLNWCSSLKSLPESIGDLKSLVELSLFGTEIEELPNSICKLSSLERFSLYSCSSLNKLPESIGDLKSLVELSMYGTKIEELPKSTCRLSSLERLDLSYCLLLNKLPESIGGLKSLVELSMCGTKIEELPNSICELSSLKRLDLHSCESLNKMPESIGDLNSLIHLCLDRTKFKELPNGVGLLEKLEVLSVMDCHNLVQLPLSGKRMKCLRIMNLIGSSILLSPDDFTMLASIVELKIGNKIELSLPPWISGFSHLLKLELQGYTRLESLPELPSTLTSLEVLDCISLQELPDLSRLNNLKILSLRNCKKLEEIRGLEGIESLETLSVHDCYKLTDTPRKIHGQGTLVVDELRRSGSLNVNDGIYKGLVLCIVFEFTYKQMLQEYLLEGELVDIRVHLEASNICRKHRMTSCNIGLLIKGVEFTTEQDIIYIHHFKGFDWFGLPLEGTDATDGISVTNAWMIKPKNYMYLISCDVKFCKLLLESTESDQKIPNKESSAKMVADFFSWSLDDVVRSPSPTIEEDLMVSFPSSYDDGEGSFLSYDDGQEE